MKTVKSYLLFALGWVVVAFAAYFGWGQGFAPARHVYMALIFLQITAVAVLASLTFFIIVMDDDKWAAMEKKPTPIEHNFTLSFGLTSQALKLVVFAWFGALWVGVLVFLLGLASRAVAEVYNAALSKRISP
jgi:hypothetical protein